MNKITKRFLTLAIAVFLAVSCLCFAACGGSKKVSYETYKTVIDKEMKGCFDFFWNEMATKETVEGNDLPVYGLIPDRYPNTSNTASIASVGFGLTAYVIGVEEGWVSKDEAQTRSKKTMDTILALQDDGDVAYEGFLAHFINMSTGKRSNKCEISSVDTAILLCGVVTAGQYFGGELETLADRIYGNINWKALEHTKNSKSYISMGYSQEQKKILSDWDWYAEQLMIYVLGAGSPNEEYRLTDKSYYDFTRKTGNYNKHEFIYSWFGSIFTYQFSHAWIDFSGRVDKKGVNWYNNSVEASMAAYEYCRDNKNLSKTFKAGGWGLTACDAPEGYNGYLGTPPRGWTPTASYATYEGTVAPAGAIGSVVFTPKESLEAMKYYQTLSSLNGEYGLKDAFNLDHRFYAGDCIGIDKGISLLMLSNYKNKAVWSVVMENQNILNGLQNLGFTAE